MDSAAHDEDPESAAFEAAERDLLEAVGLDVRSRFVDLETPDVRTHVFEAGPTDAGPADAGPTDVGPADDDVPLVFVHGTAQYGAFLAPLMAEFGDDARMIAFDRPGYGRSDPFAYTEANLQRTVVDVTEGVLDALDVDRVNLVGHSMGGHASLRFALTHPERVRRLTLVGAIPGFPGTNPPFPLPLLTVPVLGRVIQRLQKSGEEGVLDIAEIFGEREAIQDHPEFIRALAAHEHLPKAADAGASEFEALFSIRGWRASSRIREDELAELAHPTTVVWGDDDPLGGPDDVRHAVEAIPDVRFETVEAGHLPFLAHAERIATLVRR